MATSPMVRVIRDIVGNWLYGIARQTCLNLRASLGKRRARELQVANMPEKAANEPCSRNDIDRILDEELGRLDDKHRSLLVRNLASGMCLRSL